MKNLLVSFICFTSFFLNSQTWGPATPFPGASGYINNCTNLNQTFINSMCVFNNELFVGGNFSAIGGIVANGIAKWNGNSWSSVGAGNFLNSCVKDIIVFNQNLYFTADKLYKWDGATIQDFTYYDIDLQTDRPVTGTDLHVFNNELYIVKSNDLMKFNGTNFSVIDGFNEIYCIDNLNNSIYVGTNNGLFKYEAGNWIDCNGISTSTPKVYDIETYNNDLFVLGVFNSIGGISVNNFAKYNGSVWSNVTLPYNYYPGGTFFGTNHMKTMNNELYLAHTLGTNQQQTFIASPLIKYNGSQWVQIAQNYSIGGACSIIYNNELYCGGNFPSLFIYGETETIIIDHLAKLQNSSSLEEGVNLQIQISPNPTKDIISIKVETNMNQPFSIFDQMGRQVLRGKLTGTETEVNLSSLSKGIYTLKIEGNYQPAQIVKE